MADKRPSVNEIVDLVHAGFQGVFNGITVLSCPEDNPIVPGSNDPLVSHLYCSGALSEKAISCGCGKEYIETYVVEPMVASFKSQLKGVTVIEVQPLQIGRVSEGFCSRLVWVNKVPLKVSAGFDVASLSIRISVEWLMRLRSQGD